MGKNKNKRSLVAVGKAQQETEKQTNDKFAATQSLAQSNTIKKELAEPAGRISPQVSCTISLEDKEILNELTLFASNKKGKIVNTSIVIRALIRLGNEHRDKLEF